MNKDLKKIAKVYNGAVNAYNTYRNKIGELETLLEPFVQLEDWHISYVGGDGIMLFAKPNRDFLNDVHIGEPMVDVLKTIAKDGFLNNDNFSPIG